MSVTQTYLKVTDRIYQIIRRNARRHYLRKHARKNLDIKIDENYAKTVQKYYAPYAKVDPVFHAIYKQYTGTEDVRFIPDDLFANYIDKFYNYGPKAVVLENKTYFEKMFKGIRQPVRMAYRINGFWFIGDDQASYDQVRKLICGKNAVIKQACGSSGGHDVHFLNDTDSKAVFDKIIRKINNDIIIQEPIHQHETLARINPSSVNTIRVVSLLSQDGVKIYSCFLRCGRNHSKVDNASMGGIFTGVNNETGRLTATAFSSKNYKEHYTEHPDTHTVFGEVTVPSWDKICALVAKAAPQVPHSRMVGWDITVGDDGEPILIEANLNNSLFSAHQLVNGPIFKDDTQKILDEVFHK